MRSLSADARSLLIVDFWLYDKFSQKSHAAIQKLSELAQNSIAVQPGGLDEGGMSRITIGL